MSLTDRFPLFLRWRMMKDHLARHAVTLGGMLVIAAIILIFVYLIYVVLPMFKSASIEKVASYPAAQPASLYLTMEEQAQVAMRVKPGGQVEFFHTLDGRLLKQVTLPIPKGASVVSLAVADPASQVLALGLSNGQALVFRHRYKVTYPNDKRLITPEIEFPYGETPIQVDAGGLPLLKLAVEADEEQVTLAAVTAEQRVVLQHLTQKETSMFDDEGGWQAQEASVPHPREEVSFLLIDKQQKDLFVATHGGELSFYDISDWEEEPALEQHLSLLAGAKTLTSLQFLTGDISLLAGTDDGRISQWFPVRNESGKRVLTHIREFSDFHRPISAITAEQQRKGFVAVDQSGEVGLFHTTSQRTLLVEPVSKRAITHVGLAPHANAMLLDDGQQLYFYRIDNEYPEVSWSALWGKVWYESYPKPDYVWQSSSASNDFEPKLSLIPISFGTMKAAFYAMLIAIPLSIMGAIFTAHFMSPGMRQMVKPTIEVMEALPTVILGFLAGLWLAPFVEHHLPGIFALFLLLPTGVVFAAWIWHLLPGTMRHRIPEGWEAALLIPVAIAVGYISLSLSPLIEDTFFAGNIQIWMHQHLGIDYDQRNSLVVGLAMGFAVIPTIFSITEDAIFAVPKHLVQGSLALGATPWQTLMRVVLLTASPGIFSAVMIGLGRAVGETMIVLMATGNTPVMDFSVFEGMRTLSANIAVEMPESELGSTHYRVLFLAALVLFGFTFMFNTVAEVVRQRLRKRYSSL